ncbi:MAG TPA: beta-propeller fold lactonase family protein [Terriglobia bacterium]|nr:beta-propeller fold lactonase family protein [Terriglobia bacterium]
MTTCAALAALLLLTAASRRLTRAQGVSTTGAVYTMTDATPNQVVAFSRAANGALTLIGNFGTGGNGNSANLGSQGSIALAPGNQFLFAVNAKSNTISAFSVQPGGGLLFVNQVSSAGARPISLTVHGSFLYVANSGGTMQNIAGFNIAANGALSALAGSVRSLSSNKANPAEVAFSNDGTILVVTEKGTNKIDTFTVSASGLATGPLVQDSNGLQPFGFAFDNAGHLIVSEATASAVSSYSVATNGVLTLISGSVPDGGKAACWVANTNNSTFPTQFSYISNTGSGTISAYSIATDGSMTLLAGPTSTAAHPLDMALSADSQFLYVLGRGSGEIRGYSISSNGALTNAGNVTAAKTSRGLAGF